MVDITILTGVYKSTNITGGPHIVRCLGSHEYGSSQSTHWPDGITLEANNFYWLVLFKKQPQKYENVMPTNRFKKSQVWYYKYCNKYLNPPHQSSVHSRHRNSHVGLHSKWPSGLGFMPPKYLGSPSWPSLIEADPRSVVLGDVASISIVIASVCNL